MILMSVSFALMLKNPFVILVNKEGLKELSSKKQWVSVTDTRQT